MISALSRFIFPSFCLYCRREETPGTLLCPSCLEHASLIEIEGRCRRCFRLQETPRCDYCKKDPPFFRESAICFARTSPVLALHRDLSRFAKTLGAFVFVQWYRSSFPIPHKIVVEEGLEEVRKEFQRFLPLNKKKEGPLQVLYLSKKGDLPLTYEPFIGTHAYQIALSGDDD